MNIKCPNCETIFDLQKKYKINSKYKCSVCNHIWEEKKDKPNQINIAENTNLKSIIIINAVVLFLAVLFFIIFRDHLENIDSNWKNLYIFFDMLIPIQ